MAKKKRNIKSYHIFYAVFFTAYFFAIYFLLYHPNGLTPFHLNIHFFSNVIGSLSKRFLTETAPYALLFYLIYYCKKNWLKAILISIFLIIFTLNVGEMCYYFIARSNIQFYVLKGFQWNLFLSYINAKTVFMAVALISALSVLAVFLYRIKNSAKIHVKKHAFFLTIFAGLAFGGSFIPVVYSPHVTLFTNDSIAKMQYRVMDLEKPGIIVLADEIYYEYFKPESTKQQLTANEQQFIDSVGLEEKLTTDSDFHPKKIVLITVESLSQPFLSHYNKEIPDTTPFIDSLIEKYPHIDAFYPSGTYTLFGLASILCGHINVERLQKDDSYECLPNLLKKAGYLTEFIRGFSKYYVRENVFFDKIGFDTITAQEEFDKKYPDFKNERPDLYATWGFSDDYLFNEAVERLKEKKNENLFLNILTVDTHVAGGRCYREKTNDSPENDVLFSVNCFDSVLKGFFAKLESEGLFDDELLVILTADHIYPSYSAVPGDTGNMTFASKPDPIPLLLISKKPVKILASTGSQIDIAPTLLDMLDIEEPSYYMGKSLIANSNTIPMGQDRAFAYMIINSNFMGLNLFNDNTKPSASLQHYGDYFKVISGSLNEFNSLINHKRQENEMDLNIDSALVKWFRNQL